MVVFKCVYNYRALWILVDMFLEELVLLLLPDLHRDINVPFYQIPFSHSSLKLDNIGLSFGHVSLEGITESILGLVFDIGPFRNVPFEVDFPIVDSVADMIFEMLYVV